MYAELYPTANHHSRFNITTTSQVIEFVLMSTTIYIMRDVAKKYDDVFARIFETKL